MYVPETVNGATRRLGLFGAATPSTLLGPALSYQPAKKSNPTIGISTELRRFPVTSLSILHAQPSEVQHNLAPKPGAGPVKGSPPTAEPISHRRRAARYRVKRRGTSSHPGDDTDARDLPLWLGDAAPVADHSSTSISRTFASKNAQGPSLLSGSGPASGFPLSPATARALAQGFRPVDLALASSGPLQVWCRGRSETSHSASASYTATTTATISSSTTSPRPPQHKLLPSGGPANALRQQPAASHPTGPLGREFSETGNGAAAAATAELGSHRGGGGLPGGRHGGGNDRFATSRTSQMVAVAGGGGGIAASAAGEHAMPGSGRGNRDVDVDVVLLGPAGRPRDLSVLVAAVERLAHRPAGRGCVGCVVVSPSRERVEALQESAFTLLTERGGGPEAMHVMAVHGGTRFREDVSGFRSQPPDLLLTTPGRLLELLTTDQVQLGHLFESIRVLVFDGAEVLSSRAFRPQVERLLRLLPNAALCATTALPRRRGAPERGRTAVPAAGIHRAVTLMAAAAVITPAGGVMSLPAASAPVTGARGADSEAAGPATAVEAGASAAATAAAAALRLRAADQLLAVSRPLRRQQPPLALAPSASGARQGLQGEAAVAAAASAATGTVAAAEDSSLQFDLKSLTGLALRSGFATFTLPGCGDSGSGGGGADRGARTLAAAVAAALGGSAWLPPGAVQGEVAVVVPSARCEGATHGSLTQLVSKLSLNTTATMTGPPSLTSAAGAVEEDLMDDGTTASGSPSSSVSPVIQSVASSLGAAAAAAPPPLVPLHLLAVPYEEHLPYLYVVVRQHMLSEGRHKIIVQFPSAHLANLYARLFQALGFPAACAHSRVGRVGRQEAVRDFSAAHRGLLFCTELAGLDVTGCGLTLLVWVGLPRQPGQLVQYMAAVQQAAAAATTAAAAIATTTLPMAVVSGAAAAAAATQRQLLHDVTQGPRSADAAGASDVSAANNASPEGRLPPPSPPLPSAPPRCLLVLNDVESPRAVAVAAGEALATAGLGRVVPVQPGAWSGPLDDVSRLVHKALTRVPPDVKLKGLEGLLGHMWASRTSAAGAGAGAGVTAATVPAASGSVGASWMALGAGLGPQPEQQLGAWARRFAAAMGMPQPPLLSRHVAARMGLRSIPGVSMVDFHSGRPPPPGTVLITTPRMEPQAAAPPPSLRLAVRLQLQRQRWREQQIQQMLNGEQRQVKLQQEKREKEKKRQQQQEERKRQHEEARLKRQEQQLLRKERLKLHPPSVIGRYRWFRALKRAQKKPQG